MKLPNVSKLQQDWANRTAASETLKIEPEMERETPRGGTGLKRRIGREIDSPTPEHRAKIEEAIDAKLKAWPKVKRGPRIASRGLYKYAPLLVREDESLLEAGQGWFSETFWANSKNKRSGDSGNPKAGYVVLTDKRLLLIATAGIGLGARGVETIPISSMISVDASRWVGQGVLAFGAPLRINTGGGEIMFRVSPTAVADAIARYLQDRILARVESVDAPVGAPALAALEKLADLHRTGVLSDDEFQAKKTELLKRI